MIELQSYYAKTHQGPYLNLNEDDVYIDLENKIFATFDGFGGSSIGDKAVDLIKSKLKDFFLHVSADPDATLPYFFNSKYLIETNVLMNAILLAHDHLLQDNNKNEMNERGAASGLISIVSENILSTISIGNCVNFLYRNGVVTVMGAPDCTIAVGNYAQNIYLRTFPLSAIGLYEELTPVIWEHNIQPGDKVISVTDGVYANVGTDDIQRVLSSSIDEHEIIKKLFEISNVRGNLDNQSAIVLSF